MLHIMLSLIDTTRRVGQFRKVVVNIAAILEKKASIPAVMERIDIIRQVQKPVFWEMNRWMRWSMCARNCVG